MNFTDAVMYFKPFLIYGLFTVILVKIVRTIQKFRAYAKIFNDCPGEKDFHWIFGNMHKFPGPNEDGIKYDMNILEKSPRFWRVWVGPFIPVLLLLHPDLIRILLKSSAPKPRGTFVVSVYDMGLGWLGEGLLISNGSKWARSRRLLTPAFHFDILKPYILIKNQAGDVFLNNIKNYSDQKEPFEAFHLTSLCLFDILLQCAFSYKSDCQIKGDDDPYVDAVNQLLTLWSKRSLRPWQHIEFIYKLSPDGRRWYKLCDFVHSISEDLIAKRRKFLEKNEGSPSLQTGKHTLSFVDILLKAKDDSGNSMTPLEIRNEADTFLFEGFDTTTSALSWTLYSLARWPEYQQRVQEEVDSLLQGRDSDYVLWDDLSELPFTVACIKEAIRNYSTVPFIERMTNEDIILDGHKIPKGTFVACHLWMLHHNPTVWDKPHDYIPERFLGESGYNMDPFQFVPFSAGSRNCIGQNFAMHELKILVARVMRKFNLTLDPNHEVRRTPLATFKAENGIKLLATPR